MFNSPQYMAKAPKPKGSWLRILESPNEWLNVNASQVLLKQQYPKMGGFQNTLFGQSLSFRVEKGAFVQVIHGNGHWLCITRSGHDKGEIEVIDSMFSTLPVTVVKQVATMVYSQLPTLNLSF